MKKDSGGKIRMRQEEGERRRVEIGPKSRREEPSSEPDSMPRLAAGREKRRRRNQIRGGRRERKREERTPQTNRTVCPGWSTGEDKRKGQEGGDGAS